MRPLVALAFLLVAGPTRGQAEARFYPLAVGDSWTYARFAQTPGTVPEPQGWVRRTIVGDTVLDGAAWRVVRVERFRADRSRIREAGCAVRAVGDWFAWRPLADPTGECAPFEASLGGRPNVAGGTISLDHPGARADTARVGADAIPADVLDLSVDVGGMPGMVHPYAVRFAAGLGYLGYTMDHHGGHGDGEALAFARVGGRTFGADPLLEEAAAPVSPAHTGGQHH